MPASRTSVKIINAALDETPDREIILRGSIDPDSLINLRIDDYQREVMPLASLSSLVKAFQGTSSVPDVDLGMRGESYREHEDAFYLQDPVYIVDGLQRISAALHAMKVDGHLRPRLGAAIHFSTTAEWERTRFRTLNADRSKLSPNILLRNLHATIPVVEMLHLLSQDKDFVLNKRICWSQRQSRDQLISALTMLKVTGALHAHLGPGRGNHLHELAVGLQTTMTKVGRTTMRDNVKLFFDIVDQCWGVRVVAFREGATYLRQTFLWVLATMFSNHVTFWHGNKLYVEKDLLRKIQGFPVTDPEVRNLASSSGKARELLYILLLNHVNRGKRTQRLESNGMLLKPRKVVTITAPPTLVEEGNVEAP